MGPVSSSSSNKVRVYSKLERKQKRQTSSVFSGWNVVLPIMTRATSIKTIARNECIYESKNARKVVFAPADIPMLYKRCHPLQHQVIVLGALGRMDTI